MKFAHIFLILISSLTLSSCSTDDDTQNTGSNDNPSASRTFRLEVNLNGASSAQISYEVNNNAITVTEREGIRVTSNWSETITVDSPVTSISFNAANTSFVGNVEARLYRGDTLLGNDTSSSIAIVFAPLQ